MRIAILILLMSQISNAQELILHWDVPLKAENGSEITLEDISHFNLFFSENPDSEIFKLEIEPKPGKSNAILKDHAYAGCFYITTKLKNNLESKLSLPACYDFSQRPVQTYLRLILPVVGR